MKKITTLFLVFAIVCSSVIPAFAAELTHDGATSAETTLTYGVSESYIVTVPEASNIGNDGVGSLSVSISDAMLASNAVLDVYITGNSYTSGVWHLTDTANNNNKLAYTIKKNGTAIAHNDVVLSVAAGEAYNSTVVATLNLALIDNVTHAGRYADTLTFRVEKVTATDNILQGTYRFNPTAFNEPYAVVNVTAEEVQEYIDLYGADAEFVIANEKLSPYIINIAPVITLGLTSQGNHCINEPNANMACTGITPCITWNVSGNAQNFIGMRLTDGVETMIMPVEITDNEAVLLLSAIYCSLAENSEEMLNWWSQNTTKVNNKTGSAHLTTICYHPYQNSYGNSYEIFAGYDMTWEEMLANDVMGIYTDMIFPEENGVKYVAIQDADATTAALVTYQDGTPVKSNEVIQAVVYETQVVPAFNTSSANSVYAFRDTLTAMSPSGFTMSYSNNYHNVYSDDELETAYNQYLIPGMQPVACRQDDAYLCIYGCTALLASAESGAEPFIIYKVSLGNVSEEYAQYNMLPLSKLNQALLPMLRYFNRDDTVSMSNEMQQWVNTNLVKVLDEYKQVHSILFGQGNPDSPLINTNADWVWTYISGDTWSDCVEYNGWSVDEDGYIYIPLKNNARWYLSLSYGNNKVNIADSVQFKHYIFAVFVNADGEKYYCPNCFQYSDTLYYEACNGNGCSVDTMHCGLCHATPMIQHLTGHDMYYQAGMTWGEWMESEYAKWNFDFYWDSEGRLTDMRYDTPYYLTTGDYTYTTVKRDDVIDPTIDYSFEWFGVE